MTEKDLVEKLQELFMQYHEQTGRRVEVASTEWYIHTMGLKANCIAVHLSTTGNV